MKPIKYKKVNKSQQHSFSLAVGKVGKQGNITGNHFAVGNQSNNGQEMIFGNTAGSVGHQGTNAGNVTVGTQHNVTGLTMIVSSVIPQH